MRWARASSLTGGSSFERQIALAPEASRRKHASAAVAIIFSTECRAMHDREDVLLSSLTHCRRRRSMFCFGDVKGEAGDGSIYPRR